MTTPTATRHVRIDPRFGFSCLSDYNPERDMFARLAAAGRHDLVRARLAQSAHVCPGTGMHNPEGEAECEAIARLFQHAPDMLEALDKLARLGNGFEYGNSEGNLIAQAAIAKVKGR